MHRYYIEKLHISEDNMQKLRDYCKSKNEIVALFLFGSYGTEKQNANSDIDIAILFSKAVDMAELCRYQVDFTDILQTDRVDLINLNASSYIMKFEAVKDRNILYCIDMDYANAYIYRVAVEYNRNYSKYAYYSRLFIDLLKEHYTDGNTGVTENKKENRERE